MNSEMHHDLYLRQPEMFEDKKNPKKVLKLNKAIFGLKHPGKEWYDKLTSVLVILGFEQCKHEPCLYKNNMNNHLVLVAIYVDDLLIGCADKTQVEAVKKLLSNKFPVTDNGPLHHYLGIEIEREGETGAITICHSQYILEILKEYGIENSKATATPLEANYQGGSTGISVGNWSSDVLSCNFTSRHPAFRFKTCTKELRSTSRTHAGCKTNLQISSWNSQLQN